MGGTTGERMMRRTAWGVGLVLGLVLLASQAGAAIRYVDHQTGSDTINSCLLPSSPCVTIQRAIDLAEDGDTIRFACDDVCAQTVRIEDSLTGVVVEGRWEPGFASRRPVSEPSRIRPRGGSARVIEVIARFALIDVAFDGFSIFGGDVTGEASGGAGVYVSSGTSTDVRLAFSNGRIEDNTATAFGAGIAVTQYEAGGGVSLLLEDMELWRNRLTQDEDAGLHGGAALRASCSPVAPGTAASIDVVVRRSRIRENEGRSGALRLDSRSGCPVSLALERTRLEYNGTGAAILVRSADGGSVELALENDVISGQRIVLPNGMAPYGLYLWSDGGAITLDSLNDTVVGNPAGGVNLDVWSPAEAGVDATFVNSVLWGNQSTPGGAGLDLGIDAGASARISYSLVGALRNGGVLEPGPGNLDVDDPLLADPWPPEVDARLVAGSPLIDAALCSEVRCIPRPFPQPPICTIVRVAPLLDIDGDERGAPCDVGADEYVPEPGPALLSLAAAVALLALRPSRARGLLGAS